MAVSSSSFSPFHAFFKPWVGLINVLQTIAFKVGQNVRQNNPERAYAETENRGSTRG